MFVSDILAQKGTSVHSVVPSASVAEVSQQLSARRIGSVLVIDADGSVHGIVSERDVVRALSRALGVPDRDAGYAGLKDRAAVTTQWLSFPVAKDPDPAALLAARTVMTDGENVILFPSMT